MKFKITMTEAALGASDWESRKQGHAPKACAVCGKDAGKHDWALWLGHGFRSIGKAPRPLCGKCIAFVEEAREIIAKYIHHSQWSQFEILPNRKSAIELINKHNLALEEMRKAEEQELETAHG